MAAALRVMASLPGLINFYYYKGNEEAYARDERPIKAKVGMFVDYSWFVCLALTGKFLPTCYVLQITYKNIPTDTKRVPQAIPPRRKYMLLT